jgi:hypothetical protein
MQDAPIDSTVSGEPFVAPSPHGSSWRLEFVYPCIALDVLLAHGFVSSPND